MKKILLAVITALGGLPAIQAQNEKDTIIIKDTAMIYSSESWYRANSGWCYPQRKYCNGGGWDKVNGMVPYSMFDDILVSNQSIDQLNKSYHLIVKGINDTIRLEGDFYDGFANGWVIEYDFKGRKIAEGNFNMFTSKKKTWICGEKRQYSYSTQTGIWKYYINGRFDKEVDYGSGNTRKR